MIQYKKIFMTLALLLTAVTGAWADYTVTWEGTTLQGIAVRKNTATTSQTVEGITVTASNGEFFYNTTYPNGPVVIASSSADNGLVFSAENNIKSIAITFTESAYYGGEIAFEAGAYTYQVSPAAKSFALPKNDLFIGITKVVFTLEGDAPIELTPDTDKKVWTLTKMPAGNVELQVEYYPESNLFLGKEALKDKANISVLNGETAVAFDDAGKSTATVTEGNTVTAKFTGKKVLGMKVAKKGGGEPVLLTTITAADNSSFKSGSQTFGDVATVTLTGDYLKNDGSHGGWYCQGSNKTATISVAEANGANITSVKFYTAGGGSAEDKDAPFEVTTTTVTSSNITTYLNGNSIGSYGVSKIEVYGTK